MKKMNAREAMDNVDNIQGNMANFEKRLLNFGAEEEVECLEEAKEED